jgi:hypothetical protein
MHLRSESFLGQSEAYELKPRAQHVILLRTLIGLAQRREFHRVHVAFELEVIDE